MKPTRTLLVLTLGLALATPLALLARADGALPAAGPTPDQATTSRLVYGLLSDSRYAYRPRALDDALSRDVLKRYLEALDPGKVFFTDCRHSASSAAPSAAHGASLRSKA